MTARKLWGGRFGQETDPTVERFSASIQFDRALARYDIRGWIAHARMLGAVGVVSASESAELIAGLEAVLGEIERGEFPYDPQHEDIHMNVEARLREKIGPVAGKLHTGRSRNDQIATDLALYLRDAALAAQRGIAALRGVLLERAAEHVETVLPGYTHLQPWPEFNEVREFYCPGCGALLKVESVPVGNPIIFDFLPNLGAFYREWLGKPLPASQEPRDMSNEVTLSWWAKLT